MALVSLSSVAVLFYLRRRDVDGKRHENAYDLHPIGLFQCVITVLQDYSGFFVIMKGFSEYVRKFPNRSVILIHCSRNSMMKFQIVIWLENY